MNVASTYRKEETKNAVLYILERMGGKADIHHVFKVLYFADMEHLSKYGRSVTGDVYIAMAFGPVPSKTYDALKAVRGDSYFSDQAEDLKKNFHFINKYIVGADKKCDLDFLSESDVECLDMAIEKCSGKSFSELSEMSHGLAWLNTQKDRNISVKDMLREMGDTEEYAEYIARSIELEKSMC